MGRQVIGLADRFRYIMEMHGIGMFVTDELLADLCIESGKHLKAYNGKRATSGKAAEVMRLRQGVLSSSARAVMTTLQEMGQATDDEIVRVTGMNPNTCRPRRVALVEAGFIAPGETGESDGGNPSIQWRLTDVGERALARWNLMAGVA